LKGAVEYEIRGYCFGGLMKHFLLICAVLALGCGGGGGDGSEGNWDGTWRTNADKTADTCEGHDQQTLPLTFKIQENGDTATITNLSSGEEWTGAVLDNGISTSVGTFTTTCPGYVDGSITGNMRVYDLAGEGSGRSGLLEATFFVHCPTTGDCSYSYFGIANVD
jgi:hypothetical protein